MTTTVACIIVIGVWGLGVTAFVGAIFANVRAARVFREASEMFRKSSLESQDARAFYMRTITKTADYKALHECTLELLDLLSRMRSGESVPEHEITTLLVRLMAIDPSEAAYVV